MATPKFQSILVEIESQIKAKVASGQSMSYMVGEPQGGVEVTDSPPEDMRGRNYVRYRVFIYPSPDGHLTETPKIGNRAKREYTIGVSCFRKTRKRRKWLIFSDSNDSKAGVGAFEMANHVQDVLRNNNINGLCENKSGQQFTDVELEELGDPNVERVNFNFLCETLETVTSSGVT